MELSQPSPPVRQMFQCEFKPVMNHGEKTSDSNTTTQIDFSYQERTLGILYI